MLIVQNGPSIVRTLVVVQHSASPAINYLFLVPRLILMLECLRLFEIFFRFAFLPAMSQPADEGLSRLSRATSGPVVAAPIRGNLQS